MAPPRKNSLHFKGSNFFRQRLLLSVLSGKAIRISEIRAQSNEPGLHGKSHTYGELDFLIQNQNK